MEPLIHFYRTGTEPFHSLSALPDLEAVQIMRTLYVEGSVFWERFKDPQDYLQDRRQTERWLWETFCARGGRPRQTYPIYMVLGRSKWLRSAPDAATQASVAEIQIPLSLFTERDISFTYPDSMVSWLMEMRKNPDYYLPEYHGKVFLLPEILEILQVNGLPGETWGNSLPPFFANYIEAQVWNLEPLLEYLRQPS